MYKTKAQKILAEKSSIFRSKNEDIIRYVEVYARIFYPYCVKNNS